MNKKPRHLSPTQKGFRSSGLAFRNQEASPNYYPVTKFQSPQQDFSGDEEQERDSLMFSATNDKENVNKGSNIDKYFSFGNKLYSTSGNGHTDNKNLRDCSNTLRFWENSNQYTIPSHAKMHKPGLDLEDSDRISEQTTKQDTHNMNSQSSHKSHDHPYSKVKQQFIRTHPQHPALVESFEKVATSSKKDLLANLINMIDGDDIRSSLTSKIPTHRPDPDSGERGSEIKSKKFYRTLADGQDQVPARKSDTNYFYNSEFDYEIAPCLEIPRANNRGLSNRSRSVKEHAVESHSSGNNHYPKSDACFGNKTFNQAKPPGGQLPYSHIHSQEQAKLHRQHIRRRTKSSIDEIAVAVGRETLPNHHNLVLNDLLIMNGKDH